MADVNMITLCTWMGITTNATRNAIIADLLPDGLAGLEFMSADDIKDACASYAKRTDAPFPVILTPLQKQRFKSLLLWVKDKARGQLEITFPPGTTREEFIREINESFKRDQVRKEQRKVGESFHDASFNNKLKSQTQWEKFSEELESTLSMIIGTNGVPLNYVIRRVAEPSFNIELSYEEAIIQAVPLVGEEFRVDARTVHQLILKNVSEDSDAYTYIKPLLRFRDGRRDILALRERYSSDATKQAIINSAKASLEVLKYRNERSFSFEKFSAKLQKAYDELEENGRPVHNGDIVDALWGKIQGSDIQTFLASLKIDYQRNPERSYKLILQDIAAEVAAKQRRVSFAPGTRGMSATYTRQGTCPTDGVHTKEGSIFIGNYDRNKWNHESVKPYHQEIIKARADHDGGPDKGRNNSKLRKRTINAIKSNRKKLKQLQSQIAAAKSSLKSASEAENDSQDDKAVEVDNDKAGNSFGGKNSKKKD